MTEAVDSDIIGAYFRKERPSLRKRLRICAKTMKKMITLLLSLALLFSALAVPVEGASDEDISFSDVPDTAWYAAAVTYAASVGFAVGSDGKFRPNDPVTRGEFISMLSRILLPEGIPEEIPVSPFEDVPAHKFFARPIDWAYYYGITEGSTDTTFSPNENIKRQDASVMLYRAEQLPELGVLPEIAEGITFLDSQKISVYAQEAVGALQRQGVLSGDTAGYFHPKDTLTRAEAAQILGFVHRYKTGHSHEYQQVGTMSPTCIYRGYRYFQCACGSRYATHDIPALGHDYQQTETDPEAWTVTYTCTRCGASYQESLPGEKPQKIYDGNAYITYEDALSLVDRLEAMYPELIRSYVGGQSYWETDIRVVTLGKGSRYIFMNANIHGTETVTTNYLLKVLDEYAYAYVKEGKIGSYSVKPLLDTFTIVMIPCSNPDGRALETYKSAHGVNLNHNFPTNWSYASNGENGAYAGSEPETQTILGVLNQYAFEVVLDCHTSGEAIYYADYDCSSTLKTRSENIAKAIKSACGYGLYMYDASPGMANYARHPYGVPGLTIEMYPYTSGTIDCTKFSQYCWSKLSTMPAIVMSYIK